MTELGKVGGYEGGKKPTTQFYHERFNLKVSS